MEQDEKEPLDELKDYLEQRVKEQASRPPPPLPESAEPFMRRHQRLLTALSLGVIFASALYAYSASAGVLDYFLPQPEVRPGSPLSELATRDCVANLLTLAEGAGNEAGLSCPLSDQLYGADQSKIYCPSPENHCLAEMYVLRNSTWAVKVPR
jgi:hypothetical protein